MMKEKLSNSEFKIMHFIMKCIDFLSPHVKKRAQSFHIKEGETIVDYACGPGRYTVEFSKLVGKNGKVIAVDLIQIALDAVESKVNELGLTNVKMVLAKGYDSTLPSAIADKVFVLDAIHHVKNPTEFFKEINRICKNDGIMIIDNGHQARNRLKQKIELSCVWKIIEENKDHLKCLKQ